MPSERAFLVKYSGRFSGSVINSILLQRCCVYVDELFPNEQNNLIAEFVGPPPLFHDVSVKPYEIIERIKKEPRPIDGVDFWLLTDARMYSPEAVRTKDSIVTEAVKANGAIFEAYGVRDYPNLWMRGVCSSTAKVKEIESRFRQLLRQDRFSVYGVYERRFQKVQKGN